MKGWDKGRILQHVGTYETTSIGKAKFLYTLKEAGLQYVKTEASNIASKDDDSLQRSLNRQAILNRMNSTII
jgi:hypothetical protein